MSESTKFSKASMNKALKLFPELTEGRRKALLKVRDGGLIRKSFPNSRDWLWDKGLITPKTIYGQRKDVLTKAGEALVHLVQHPEEVTPSSAKPD